MKTLSLVMMSSLMRAVDVRREANMRLGLKVCRGCGNEVWGRHPESMLLLCAGCESVALMKVRAQREAIKWVYV